MTPPANKPAGEPRAALRSGERRDRAGGQGGVTMHARRDSTFWILRALAAVALLTTSLGLLRMAAPREAPDFARYAQAIETALADSYREARRIPGVAPALPGWMRSLASNALVFERLRRRPGLFTLRYSIALGGAGVEQLRDVAVAADGTAYVAGFTSSGTFANQGVQLVQIRGDDSIPPYPGANPVWSDVFVARISRKGGVVWMRSLGGPNSDLAYALELAPDGDVIVAGRAGPGFPTTPGSAQPAFGGDTEIVAYGPQDGFVAKLDAATGDLLWSSFVGGDDGAVVRDVDVDAAGNPVVAMIDTVRSQPFVAGQAPGAGDGVVAKLAADGTRFLWARYLGGAAGADHAIALRVDPGSGRVLVVGNTSATDFPAGAGFDSSFGGPVDPYGNGDAFLVALTPDGQRIEFASFLGGRLEEGTGTHNIAIGAGGGALVGHWTRSTDVSIVPGAVQSAHANPGGVDAIVWRMAPDGALRGNTYLGGQNDDNIQGIDADADGNAYVALDSVTSFPTTRRAVQSRHAGGGDGAFAMLSPDLGKIRYATLIGGSGLDRTRALDLGPGGSVFITGLTASADWPITRGERPRGGVDGVVVRFDRSDRSGSQ
jgi:hypothetical protein